MGEAQAPDRLGTLFYYYFFCRSQKEDHIPISGAIIDVGCVKSVLRSGAKYVPVRRRRSKCA